MWYSRAESCFGKQFADMQALASRYRSLAAAGHLPVPPAPPTPISGSRFFTRKSPTQPPELSADGHDFLAGMVTLAAVGLAYAIAHPDQLPTAPPASPTPNAGMSAVDLALYQQQGQQAECAAAQNCKGWVNSFFLRGDSVSRFFLRESLILSLVSAVELAEPRSRQPIQHLRDVARAAFLWLVTSTIKPIQPSGTPAWSSVGL